jgi:FkbM family methyltransferase
MFSRARVPDDISVLYFDMGTHREGAELALMVDTILPKICNHFEAYGFEANRGAYEQVKNKFTKQEHVSLFHKALCYTLPTDGKIKLYHSADGVGDSLYRHGASYEEVETIRFSDWLHKNHIILKDKICLLRMNIEGAEYDVIQDLVASGFDKYIDGYYGMWDDLSKINRQRDRDFRAFMSKNHIYPFTFNGRDVELSFRIRCIEYDIKTHVQAGLLKLAK